MSKSVAPGIEKLGEQHYRVWWQENRTGERRSRVVRDSLEEAKAYRSAMLDAQTRGEYVSPDKITLGAWLDTWLERREIMGGKRGEGRRSTQERYVSLLGGTVRDRLGSIPLQGLTVDDLEGYYVWAVRHEVTKRGTLVSAETIRKRHKTLKLALETATKKRLIPYSPADYADTPSATAPTPPVFTRHDVDVILAALEGHWLALPVTVALHTGCRLGEVLGLVWPSVEFPDKAASGRGWLTVDGIISEAGGEVKREPWAKTKRSRRRIALDTELTGILRQHRKQQRDAPIVALTAQALVCPGPLGTPRRPSRVTGWFTAVVRMLEDAGELSTEGATFHTLRHTHATWLRQQGVPIEVISARLGHSRTSTTQDKYVHFGDHDELAAEALDGMFPTYAEPTMHMECTSGALEGPQSVGL